MEDSEKTLEVAEPTEVETETTDATPEEEVAETEEAVELTDTSKEEEADEAEDNSEEEQKTEVKQTKEENSKYAQARRKAEAETEAKVQEAYKKGRLDAFVGKYNPYTNTIIQDETDIKVYENMYALEKEGKDPVADYAGYVANKQRQELKEQEEKQRIQAEAEADVKEFMEKYPDVNLNDLFNNEMFRDYIEGKQKSLATLYENYQKLENSFRNKAVDVAKQTIANSQSSPGSLGSGSDVTIDYSSMSSTEFQKYVQRAKDGELR